MRLTVLSLLLRNKYFVSLRVLIIFNLKVVLLMYHCERLLKKIQYFFPGVSLLAMSESSDMQSHQFVAWSIYTVVFLPIFVL